MSIGDFFSFISTIFYIAQMFNSCQKKYIYKWSAGYSEHGSKNGNYENLLYSFILHIYQCNFGVSHLIYECLSFLISTMGAILH